MKEEIYCSTDIEADGKAPGLSNMLSFATVAFNIDKEIVGRFSANLELMPEAKPSPSTEAFWASNQAAYQATREDMLDPGIAMANYRDWLAGLGGIRAFVAYPMSYDFKWIDWYAVKYLGENPFSFSRAIDVKSVVWPLLGGNFQDCTKRSFPKRWFDKLPHTHIAEDDALEQGAMFINILREIRNLPPIRGIPNFNKYYPTT